MENVIKFLEKAEELENEHPFLYVEIGRTRITDYMAWLRVKPSGELIVTGQGLTADDACKDALEGLSKTKCESCNGSGEILQDDGSDSLGTIVKCGSCTEATCECGQG